MASIIGASIVLVGGLIFALWLPLRIRAVWRGEKSAPPIPLRKSDRYFLGYHVFEVDERTFPAFGTAMFSMAGFALFLGLSGVLESMGSSSLVQPLTKVAVVLLVLAFVFAIIALIVFNLERPKFLIPPGQREETG